MRRCPVDEREHYPRTDPAVIVAITDPQDRLLIAHASYWSERRYSHLAGYVEPGESLEQAARREVGEEASLTLASLVYVASQPWPFPASIMVGFRATVEDPNFTLDDDEISDAMWVTRDELAGARRRRSRDSAARGVHRPVDARRLEGLTGATVVAQPASPSWAVPGAIHRCVQLLQSCQTPGD